MDSDTPDTSADNAMSDIGIPSFDRTRPIARKARPTVRKQHRSRLTLRRAVARLAQEAKRITPNLTIRITKNTMEQDFVDWMDLEEMNLDENSMDSRWQLVRISSIPQHQQRHSAGAHFLFRDQVVERTPFVTDRWTNDDDGNDDRWTNDDDGNGCDVTWETPSATRRIGRRRQRQKTK
jgi:hypothetical protein